MTIFNFSSEQQVFDYLKELRNDSTYKAFHITSEGCIDFIDMNIEDDLKPAQQVIGGYIETVNVTGSNTNGPCMLGLVDEEGLIKHDCGNPKYLKQNVFNIYGDLLIVNVKVDHEGEWKQLCFTDYDLMILSKIIYNHVRRDSQVKSF